MQIICLKNIQDKSELFKELKKQLEFPAYFGMNWDALNDSLGEVVRTLTEDLEINLINHSLPQTDVITFTSICTSQRVAVRIS